MSRSIRYIHSVRATPMVILPSMQPSWTALFVGVLLAATHQNRKSTVFPFREQGLADSLRTLLILQDTPLGAAGQTGTGLAIRIISVLGRIRKCEYEIQE
jgi:hypothetical protein